MSTLAVVLIVTFALVILIMLEVPIGISVGLAGALGIVLIDGLDAASRVMGSAPYASAANYGLLVIPMYILMGATISNTGIGAGIYRAVFRVVGRLPAGLPVATVIATALFSGISGSSAADVAVFGRISAVEMSKYGYSKPYAAAVVASAGAFAALIPPSIVTVLYAIIANESVATLIVAGIIPGIVCVASLAGFLVIVDLLRAKRGDSAPASSARDLEPDFGSQQTSLRSDLGAIAWALVLFGIAVGGLYGGVFTATEAGAMAAFAALVVTLLSKRSDKTSKAVIVKNSFKETAVVTSMIFLLILGASVFGYFFASARITPWVADLIQSINAPPIVIVALILLVFLPLGIILDGLTTLVIAVPLFAPIVTELGFSGIWFGILVITMIEIGLILPPDGLNAFIISGLIDVPVADVFRSLVPFAILNLAVVAVLFAFPDITLWLPSLVGLL